MRFRFSEQPRRGAGTASKRSRRQRHLRLESLEGRQLLATTAAQHILSAVGPITDIAVGVDGSLQVHHAGFTQGQFYSPSSAPADAGLFIRHADGTVDGIDLAGRVSAASSTNAKAFHPISQTLSTDGLTVTTVFDNTGDGNTSGDLVQVTQTVTYQPTKEFFTVTNVIKNTGTAAARLDVFFAGDIYLANSDAGVGLLVNPQTPSTVAIGGTDVTGNFHIFFQPRTGPTLVPATNFEENRYSTIWQVIGGGANSDFNNSAILPTGPAPYTNDPALIDNGAGVEWKAITVPANGQVTVSNYAAFGSITTVVLDQALSITAVPIQTFEGAPFSGPVATFTHAGSADPASAYSATIDWGDGTTSLGTVQPDPTTPGQFVVSGVPPTPVPTPSNPTPTTPASHVYAEERAAPYVVSVSVVDNVAGVFNSATTSASVSDAPLTLALVPFAPTEGRPFTGVVAAFTDADVNGQVSDYLATINWGDGTSANPHITVGQVQRNGSGGFNILGNIAYFEEGAYPLTVTVTDIGHLVDAPTTGAATTGAVSSPGASPAAAPTGGGTTPTGPAAGAAQPVAAPAAVDLPLTGTGVNFKAQKASPFTGIVATFTDADPAGALAQYSALISWGDGATSTGTIAADVTTPGRFTVTGTHTYSTAIPFSVRTTITDIGGATTSPLSTATVVNDLPLTGAAGVPISAGQGSPFSGAIATFTDTDPAGTASQFTALINWGDNSTSLGTVAAASGGNGQFIVSGIHVYQSPGRFTVNAAITDAGGSVAGTTSTAVVLPAPVLSQTATATGTVVVPDSQLIFVNASAPIPAVEGNSFGGAIATFFDIDLGGMLSDYTATITYDDGTSVAAVVAVDPASSNRFIVTPPPDAPHTFAEEGAHPVKVDVFDQGGAHAVALISFNVADAPLAAVLVPPTVQGKDVSGVVANFVDADTGGTTTDYTATISWGDGTASPGVVLPNPNGVGFSVVAAGSHTYAAEGTFPIGVVIADVGGSSVSVGGQANIPDQPLSATGVAFSTQQRVPFTGVVASFIDADPTGTVATYGALIDWGDGTVTVGTVTPHGGGPGQFDIVGSHTYAAAGTFTPIILAADVGGARSLTSTTATVNPPPTFPITGRLDAASDTGPSRSDAITSTTLPTFSGTAGPNTTVQLVVADTATNTVVASGQVLADASGHWSIAVGTPLSDGSYFVVASATDALGNAASRQTNILGHPLVIETTAPKITNAVYDPTRNVVTLSFHDAGAGLSLASVRTAAAYTLARITSNGTAPVTIRSIRVSGSRTDPVATLVLSPPPARTRSIGLQLAITGARIINLAGIPLDGSFTVQGGFPTGSNQPGSNFNGQFLPLGSAPAQAIPAIFNIDTRGAAQHQTFLKKHTPRNRP